VLHGKGCHAAMPHMGVDPVPVACQLVQAFQTVISRNKKPIDTAVISVTMIHAGEATNVVPNYVTIEGTVRTFSDEVTDMIEARMRKLTEHTASAFECSAEFEFSRNYPATVNHAAEANFAHKVLAEMLGEDNALVQEPTMGAEDFSFFLQVKPGAYIFLANGDGSHRDAGHGLGPCMLHNPSYDFNDDLIPIGGSFWVNLVERWFAEQHAR
jgi:amidohydrolase